MELNDFDFKNIRDYIQETIGISLQDEKKYLISQRLEPVAKQYNCRNFSEFYLKLKQQTTTEFRDRIIAAITTNETSFFRDSHPFDTFRDKIMPLLNGWVKERKSRLYMRRGPKVSIWCAASSTGQEPYTLAMIIAEYLANGRFPDVIPEDYSIIATDISSEVLAKAMSGRYEQNEINRGVPAQFRQKYFTQEGKEWVIAPEIQQLVDFRRLNLIQPFQYLGSFDIIFCRNVLIYFDLQHRTEIMDQFYNMLNPDGYLFLGASENIFGVSTKFVSEHIGRTIGYKKKPAAKA